MLNFELGTGLRPFLYTALSGTYFLMAAATAQQVGEDISAFCEPLDGLIAELDSLSLSSISYRARERNRAVVDDYRRYFGAYDPEISVGIPNAVLPGASECELWEYDIPTGFPQAESGGQGIVYACRWNLSSAVRSEFTSFANNLAACIHRDRSARGPDVVDGLADFGERFYTAWAVDMGVVELSLSLSAYKVASKGMTLILQLYDHDEDAVSFIARVNQALSAQRNRLYDEDFYEAWIGMAITVAYGVQ